MAVKRASSVLILDANNHVLILRRGETHPYAALRPDLPGGVVEPHETHIEGLVREIQEEIGLSIEASDLKKASLITHHDFYFVNTIEHSLFLYRVEERPDVVLSWEHDQHMWVPLHEVEGLERPVQREFDRLRALGFLEDL